MISLGGKKNLLKSLILVLSIEAAALAGWWWFYRGVNKMSLNIDILREEIAVAETKQKNIKLLTQTFGAISDKKSKLDKVFIDEKSVVRFIKDLEKLAILSGSTLEISSADLPAKAEGGGPSFNLGLRGSFGRLFKFLTLIEKMNYQLKIESASLQALKAEEWGLQISLRLLSYRF